MSTEKDMKFDGDKCRLDLIEPAFTEGVGNVLTFGAKKYKAESWKTVKDGLRRYLTAAERHILAIKKGELIDSESGLPHAYHAATDLMMVQWFIDSVKGPHAEYAHRPGGIAETSAMGPLTQILVPGTIICPRDGELCVQYSHIKCIDCSRGV